MMQISAVPGQKEIPPSSSVSIQPEIVDKPHIPPNVLDACLFASLILVVVICIGLVWETRLWSREVAGQNELNIVETLAGDLRRSFESLDFSITQTSKALQVPGVRELPRDLQQLVLFDDLIQVAGVSATIVVGDDGRLRSAANDQTPPSVSFSDQAYFEFHRTHPEAAVHIAEPTKDRLSGKPVIILSKRINDNEGNFAGIVAGGIDLSHIQDLFKKVHAANEGVVSLIDTSGQIIAQLPAEATLTTGHGSETKIVEHAARAASGTFTGTSEDDGRQRLIAYRSIDGFPFVVSFAQPTENVFARWTNGTLIVGAASLVLSVFGTYMILELRRERGRRTLAENQVRVSAHRLSVVNDGLEQRIAQEVQSRKQTQEKLAKSQRLEAVGQLAGGIAHDINNVLQTVTGACSLVQAQEAANDDIQRLTAIAISAADRGRATTQRLLLFARRADIKAESVDTAAILDDLQDLLRHTLCGNVVLKVDLADNVPQLVADRMQLETVIINLATNARDAMPDGGTITISARAESVGERDAGTVGLAPGRYVRLTVADTGIGMDEHILARAAEPFFSTKNVGQGTGLGLSMAKGFTEQSGGKFEIASHPDRGTVVSLWYPAGELSCGRNLNKVQAPVRRPRSGAKICMLLVDDNIEASELMGEWLAASAHEVHYAQSGEQALATIRSGLEINLLLTDLSMPGMDGLQLIRATRKIIPDLPAILLTGNVGAAAELTTGDAVGENCLVLQKPIRLIELVNHIGTLLHWVDAPLGAG